MNVTLDTAKVQSLSSLPESLNAGVSEFYVPASPVLSGKNVSVTSASPDLESILATLCMETNEARLTAARSRLASALTQLTGLSEDEQAKVEKMKAEAEAQRRAREEMYTKTIGGAMVKRTMETTSGTAKKDKEADDRVRRALDRDFGAPVPEKKPSAAPSPKEKDEKPAVIDFSDDFK